MKVPTDSVLVSFQIGIMPPRNARDKLRLMLVALMVSRVAAKPCSFTSPLTLQLVLEYAEWRSWDQVVLFDNVSPFGELCSRQNS